MTHNVRRCAGVAALLVACLGVTAGCGTRIDVLQHRVGEPLGSVAGAVATTPVAATAQDLATMADRIAKRPRDETDPDRAAVVAGIRAVDPAQSAVVLFGFDGCSSRNPRLVRQGDTVFAKTDVGPNCVRPDPQTMVVKVAWTDLPARFWLGRDTRDPGRIRVENRQVIAPRTWTPASFRRHEYPNAPALDIVVAATDAEKTAATGGRDVDRRRVRYGAGDYVIVVRSAGCPTSSRLVLTGPRLVFAADRQEQQRKQCGTSTVEISAFVVAKKALPERFVVGPGTQKSEYDVTVRR